MKEWFMLDPLRSALLCVAVPATAIMVLQTVMIFIGMAGHSDVDIQGDNGIDGVFGNDAPDATDVHIGDSWQRFKIFIVKYQERIIGGSVCIYSGDTAYLWFSGGMNKTHLRQYPSVMAVWQALTDANNRGCKYLEFMDVGTPFRKHGYRDFVLRFGGEQISTRRWFKFKWKWLNRLCLLLYS